MITFFSVHSDFIAVQSSKKLPEPAIEKLSWLFLIDEKTITSKFDKPVFKTTEGNDLSLGS